MRRIQRYLLFFAAFYFAILLTLFVQHRQQLSLFSRFYVDVQVQNNGSSISSRRPSPKQEGLSIIGAPNEKLMLSSSSPSDFQNPETSANLILMWSGPTDVDQRNLGGCPDYGCVVTHERRLLNRSAAIVFLHGSGEELPSVRYPWQYYVFFTQESPSHIQVVQPYKHFFNLTLSYRRDSDAPSPYGYAVNRSTQRFDWKRNLTSIIVGKRKLVAWFVSNCGAPSNRDAYVNELKKWIPVDVYGACGNFTCSREPVSSSNEKLENRPWSYDTNEDEDFERDKTKCDRLLEKNYKFYLAFENSICKDYTTEKFWHKLTLRIVPIVLKRSIVENYAPPGSFIAADDFQSPRQLAMYLKRLDADPIAYERRFEWRVNYRVVFLNGRIHDVRERPWGFCTLCSIISQKRTRKTYETISDWWTKQGQCDNDSVTRLLGK